MSKPLWGMTHNFGVFILWGRETSRALETFLGEFSTAEQAKAFATEHHQANKWANYRVGAI